MKIAGIGMAFAIILDASIVRMLLVPALVTLMGPANWWMPRFARRRERAVAPAEPEAVETPATVAEP
jgi:RND superfamily putative drug exporter